MNKQIIYKIKQAGLIFFFAFIFSQASAQTDADGIMMLKNNLCIGATYNYSSWTNYWEGTHKRDNANLGKVSTQMAGIMGIYGVTSKLNVLFGIPYVKTKATGGQLHGMKGLQDLSLWVKYMPVEKIKGNNMFSVYALAGFSFPVTDYNPDFLPLAIGMHSNNFSLRGIVDYQMGDWFATGSATYVMRDNIKLYRDSYYTTEMHYTNEVKMPDAAEFNLRVGYRTHRLIAEALLSNWTTLGGFDITKNNMPFPSNKMNMTSAGVNIKYEIKPVKGLSLIGGSNYTIAGRNVGQSTSYNAGIFYVLNFKNQNNKPSNKL